MPETKMAPQNNRNHPYLRKGSQSLAEGKPRKGEALRLSEESEIRRLAEQAEQERLQAEQEAEAQRLAEEAEAQRLMIETQPVSKIDPEVLPEVINLLKASSSSLHDILTELDTSEVANEATELEESTLSNLTIAEDQPATKTEQPIKITSLEQIAAEILLDLISSIFHAPVEDDLAIDAPSHPTGEQEDVDTSGKVVSLDDAI